MVGGSVNGKPFKPDPTSYEMTGIPCGNPERYKSRGIIRMVQNKNVPFESQRMDKPGDGTESEAQQHLKDMLDKQLKTEVSLESETRKRKTFTKGVVYEDFGKSLTGPLTLEQYKNAEETSRRAEELQLLGLTTDEVKFKLNHEQGQPVKKGRYAENPSSIKNKIDAMDLKIERKKQYLSNPDTFSNVRVMSRHLLEVEKSLNAGTEKASHLSHLVTLENTNTARDQALLEVLQKNNLLRNKTGECSKGHFKCESNSVNKKDGNLLGINTAPSQWTNKCQQVLESTSSVQKAESSQEPSLLETVISPCSREGMENVTDRTLPVIEPLPVEVIMRNKLSIDEIKAIPRFKNYSPGEESEILYLKNLASKIKQEDLVALFIRFQEDGAPKLVFKLLKGRMKGQAFVTFPDIPTAKEAFDLVNGYKINDKPIIIEFGKRKEETSRSNEIT